MRLRERLLRRDLEQELEQLQSNLHREWCKRVPDEDDSAALAS